MANIGKLAVLISANAQKLYGTLQSAGSKIGAFASNAASKLKSVGGGIMKFLGPVGSLLGGAITSQLGSLVDKFGELGGKIDKAAKDGRRLGLTTDVMMGLEGAAGEAGLKMEMFIKSLMKARGRVKGDFLEGLAQVADKVKETVDPMQRAMIVQDMFEVQGEMGAQMLTLLEGGGQNLKDVVKTYKDLGYALDDTDSAKIEAANDSLQRMNYIVQGVYNKLIVGFAPAITFFSAQFQKLAPFINWLSGAAGDAMTVYWSTLIALVEILITDVVKLASEWLEMSGDSASWFASWPTWGQAVRAVLYGLAVAIGYIWDFAKSQTGAWMAAFGGAILGLGKAASALGLSWGKTMEDLGKATVSTGASMFFSFGATHGKIDKFFADLDKKADATKAKAEEARAAATYTAVAANLKGSASALSIETKFRMDAMLNPQVAVAQRQLVEAQKQTDLLSAMAGKLAGNALESAFGLGPNFAAAGQPLPVAVARADAPQIQPRMDVQFQFDREGERERAELAKAQLEEAKRQTGILNDLRRKPVIEIEEV